MFIDTRMDMSVDMNMGMRRHVRSRVYRCLCRHVIDRYGTAYGHVLLTIDLCAEMRTTCMETRIDWRISTYMGVC